MRRTAKLILGGLGSMTLGGGLAIMYGKAGWEGKTSRLVQRLNQGCPSGRQRPIRLEEVDLLPAPVAKYFRRVLREGQPMICSTRITQAGEFRAGGADDGWSPFTAMQYVSAQPPGFVWDARIRMAPLMRVRVRDTYVAGQGSMEAKILSLVPIVNEHGKAELNAAALQRYLAEGAWFPTALLPRAGVTWNAIDESRALATLTDNRTSVSLEFHFNASGEIATVFSPGRYREVKGKYELTPWAGHFRKYEEIDGMRIPVEADVEWQLPSGRLPYFKGRVIEMTYAFVSAK